MQLQLIKLQFENLKQLKEIEQQKQLDYILNCQKVMRFVKATQQQRVKEEIQKLELFSQSISTDIQAFKNLRTQLHLNERQSEQAPPSAKSGAKPAKLS
mmetsp:Transcript_12904/g.21828  ORF Transcript_12904/g.21828 Transcript_12904/m.21828 type:complete len:99 (+) Transcript_12904:91-387(+)